jgi:primosomal protein N' (replication factor Y)
MIEFAEVAVPVAVRKTFAYSVPPSLRHRLQAGARVLVPFFRKLLPGIVVAVSSERPVGDFKLKSIHELLDETPLLRPDLIATALWIADYYFTFPGEVLRILFPAGSHASGIQRVRLTVRAKALLTGGLRPPGLHRQENAVLEILDKQGAVSLKELAAFPNLGNARRWVDSLSAANLVEVEVERAKPRIGIKEQLGIRALRPPEGARVNLPSAQRRLYELLEPDGPALPLRAVLRKAVAAPSSARSLQARGLVEIAPMQVGRMPLDLADSPAKKVLVLTDAQASALDALRGMLLQRTAVRCLLYGVTGSGKTEIYLRLIAETVRSGGRALLLVPEIGLTPLLSRIALSHFPEEVALLHSGMSPGERYDQWNRIRRGEAPIVVGTRSAVFAPLEELRLVIIDEEQDASYKQDEVPCYHAREVAWHRIQQSSGVLLLGSATPSIETYYAAAVTGEMKMLSLPERIEARPLPSVSIVDMGVEFQRHGRSSVISEPLLRQLRETMQRREQAIILLNRRGYARTLLCRSCGHAFTCPDCSISMPFHQEENLLMCHYCGRQANVPAACVSCGGEYIYFVGVGTEQLEERLRSLLPETRIARLDHDTARRRGALRRILLEFADGKLDLLVGTQILAKGHDFPNVTLVGVVAADAGLSFPDFRSAERTFQLLTQVAGRAGRGEVPGKVVIQSFYPDHYALQYLRRQDYPGFFQRELEYRRLLSYPPFSGLIQILVSESGQSKAFQIGGKIADALKARASRSLSGGRFAVLGPASAPLEKLRGKYRVQVLIKADSIPSALPVLHTAFQNLAARKLAMKNVRVDVDPLSLL